MCDSLRNDEVEIVNVALHFPLLVVQLFNAVSKQQKELEARLKEAGPSERKKSKGGCGQSCDYHVHSNNLTTKVYDRTSTWGGGGGGTQVLLL